MLQYIAENFPNLEVLDITKTQYDLWVNRDHPNDADLAALAPLTKLHTLKVGGFKSEITGTGFAHLSSLTNLKTVDFSHNRVVSAEGLKTLVQTLPQVENLNFDTCINLDNKIIKNLEDMKGLKNLVIGFKRPALFKGDTISTNLVTAEALEYLIPKLPNLEQLDVSRCTAIKIGIADPNSFENLGFQIKSKFNSKEEIQSLEKKISQTKGQVTLDDVTEQPVDLYRAVDRFSAIQSEAYKRGELARKTNENKTPNSNISVAQANPVIREQKQISANL